MACPRRISWSKHCGQQIIDTAWEFIQHLGNTSFKPMTWGIWWFRNHHESLRRSDLHFSATWHHILDPAYGSGYNATAKKIYNKAFNGRTLVVLQDEMGKERETLGQFTLKRLNEGLPLTGCKQERRLILLRRTDVPYVVTKSVSGAEPTYHTSLRKSFF